MNICIVNKCESKVVGRSLCSRHWQQWKHHGRVMTETAHRYSPLVREIDCYRVGLLDVYDNIVGWTRVSPEDVEIVRYRRFRTDKGRYAAVMGEGRTVTYLHTLVLPSPEGFDIDHINGDGLDNRRDNLRIATRSQNAANKQFVGVKGVRKVGSRYVASISNKANNGKSLHLGSFKTEREAAIAYNKAARKIFGEFARLNIV